MVLEFAPVSAEMYQLPFENYNGPLQFFKEGDVIKIDEDELQVLFTPGHSPGHVSFYHQPGGFVIDGDVLFNSSIGRTDLPGGDYETLMRSITEKLLVLPDDVIVYCGHGPETSIGQEKATNPFVLEYLAEQR